MAEPTGIRQDQKSGTAPATKLAIAALLLGLVGLAITKPEHVIGALVFSLKSLFSVAHLVVPGILLAAWIIASGADRLIAKSFEARAVRAILAASAVGAVTPVCGVTVLPLMAGLLAAGVPLAPIMAFWLSSPVTDPAMLATTVATLGVSFALGKTLAAFGLGLLGGGAVLLFSSRAWVHSALRDNRLIGRMNASCADSKAFEPRIWLAPDRRRSFANQAFATARLIVFCLIPAFAAEYALNAMLTPGSLAAYAGAGRWWAIPAAVLVGAPAYIDGYAALPLTRALIDNGMSRGAAMAFLVSGGVVSIWGAIAIFPVLKLKPFLLYLAVAVTGSILTGYLFDVLAGP